MTARIVFEAAGPLTSIQDAGRTGAMRFGVPPSARSTGSPSRRPAP
ncbi:MAG: hypothetical protein K2X68_07050 [Novosphingobium sp.]|nr:hypothetical protein [Novosphingobium sp.]